MMANCEPSREHDTFTHSYKDCPATEYGRPAHQGSSLKRIWATARERPYKTLSRCNQALVRARNEGELTRKICEILVDIGGYSLAWVAYGQPDQPHGSQVVAQAGHNREELKDFQIKRAESPSSSTEPGLTVKVIREGRIMISGIAGATADPSDPTDPADSPNPADPWNHPSRQEYLSFISFPLQAEGKAFGALNVMTGLTFSCGDQELQLLTELADDLAFGITTIRERRHHKMTIDEKMSLEAQLRQAQKMEAIGTLAGGIAHDFNNLLHAILGYSGILLKNLPPDSEEHKFSRIINETGISAAGLIRQILTFSRQNSCDRQPIQIQHLVKGALRLLRSTLPTTIELRSQIDMYAPLILADTTEVNQVVMNLGTNAYHAMRQNGGTLEVELAVIELNREAEEAAADLAPGLEQLQPGRHLCLQVRDSGSGISRETMPQIFDPYFTTKSPAEGTGLGLSITLGIVKKYQGAVTVRSTVGQGTTFKLFFPLFEQTVSSTCSQAATTSAALPELHGKRVIFVDDVEYNVILGEHTLGLLGCVVTGCTDSREALHLFQSFPDKFDLIITDQTMPKLTGFEMAQAILKVRPQMPIILITGHSDLVDEEAALAAGIRSFMTKPLELNDITGVLGKIFKPH